MSKPEDIPQGVWDAACAAANAKFDPYTRAYVADIARAILSAEKRGEEREREAIAQEVEAIEKGIAAIPVRSDIVRSASGTMIDVLRTIASETRKRGA